MTDAAWGILVAVFVAVALLAASVRVVLEYERGVIFRLGRVIGAKGPGLIFLIPIVDRMVRVTLRTITMDVPKQDVITKDNVTVSVNAVAYFNVIDPIRSVVAIEDHINGTSQIAQTTLRSVLGQVHLDELLTRRDDINQRLQQIIDQLTSPWGVKVTIVEIKQVELPDTMRRAMARQAEAERERRAKVIHASRRARGGAATRRRRRDPGGTPGGDAATHPVHHGRGRHRAELDADLPAAHGGSAADRQARARTRRSRSRK